MSALEFLGLVGCYHILTALVGHIPLGINRECTTYFDEPDKKPVVSFMLIPLFLVDIIKVELWSTFEAASKLHGAILTGPVHTGSTIIIFTNDSSFIIKPTKPWYVFYLLFSVICLFTKPIHKNIKDAIQMQGLRNFFRDSASARWGMSYPIGTDLGSIRVTECRKHFLPHKRPGE